jgi:hypothetical protein
LKYVEAVEGGGPKNKGPRYRAGGPSLQGRRTTTVCLLHRVKFEAIHWSDEAVGEGVEKPTLLQIRRGDVATAICAPSHLPWWCKPRPAGTVEGAHRSDRRDQTPQPPCWLSPASHSSLRTPLASISTKTSRLDVTHPVLGRADPVLGYQG